MSKVYQGFVGGEVYVLDGKKKKRAVSLPPGVAGFAWGVTNPSAAALAYSILFDALNSDAGRAQRLKIRFMHRVIAGLNKEMGWTLTLDHVLATVADIEKIESWSAPMKKQVAREPARVESDRGPGIVWDNERNE